MLHILSLSGLDSSHRACGTRGTHEICHTFCFSREHARPEIRQPIIAASRIVEFSVRTFVGLLDKFVLKEPADCPIKRPGAEPDSPHAFLTDSLHDRVSVRLAIRERNEEILRGILDAYARGEGASEPYAKALGDFHASCMDESAIEKVGAKPLDRWLKAIAEVKDKKGLTRLFGTLQGARGSGVCRP